jgi:hypothetical protein
MTIHSLTLEQLVPEASLVPRRWTSPTTTRNAYRQKLEAIGFVNVRVRSIAHFVYPGTLKYSGLRRAGRRLKDTIIPSADKPGA